MDLLTETISTASQCDTSWGAVLTFNDQRSWVIRTSSGNRLNPKGAFVTGQVLSSSRHSESIVVHTVPFGDKKLTRRERIVLPVTKSECGNYFEVESEDLDMVLWEESVEELEDAFNFMLGLMWEEYVIDDLEKMAPGALKIRARLKNAYFESV